jgi:hypothetical protein
VYRQTERCAVTIDEWMLVLFGAIVVGFVLVFALLLILIDSSGCSARAGGTKLNAGRPAPG